MYLLFFGALLIVMISAIEFVITKHIVWKKRSLDAMVVLLFAAAFLSIAVVSPNKVQAALNPILGLVPLFSFMVIYFSLSREKNSVMKHAVVYFSSIVTALLTIFYFFTPFKNAVLPTALQVLKDPYFTPVGSYLDTVLFLGFIAVLAFSQLISKKEKKTTILASVSLVFSLIAVSYISFILIKTKDLLVLPPYNLSWFAAVETLKLPLTALFGVGVDNFSSMFTRVKDAGYNISPLWQISSFNVSRSAFLHIFTETGFVGTVAFVLLFLQQIKRGLEGSKDIKKIFPVLYLIVISLFFPPSLIVFFIIFLGLIGIGYHEKQEEHEDTTVLNMGSILPLYIIIVAFSLLFVGVSGYFVGRSYVAELYFKKSLDGFAGKNVKTVYDNMRKAVMQNAYVERFRLNFSQTNLLIANNIASKATPVVDEVTGQKKTPQLTEEERTMVSQAIQAAIQEAKTTVTLNPQKASNWENLAIIYRNIINVAQGADAWTVSAYQRAIMLDPQNPMYRVSLGGIFFSFKNYDEAEKAFEQAIAVKQDWANSYYNLAWSAFQKQDYQKAVIAMQNTLSLLDPKKEKADYEKAAADLIEFKKKIPEEKAPVKAADTSAKPSQLNIPTPQALEVEPKIQLPKTASPEAPLR